MAALWIFLAVLALGANAQDLSLSLEPQLVGGFHLVLNRGDESEVVAHIGRTLVGNYILQDQGEENQDQGIFAVVGGVNLTIQTLEDTTSGGYGVKISWDGSTDIRLEDCIDFGTKHWYAGPMQFEQVFPIESATQVYSGYVSKESDNGAIAERYWLNSAGEYYYVYPEVPLFIDYNNLSANHLCFGAQIAAPYSSRRNHTSLTYDIWFFPDSKQAHTHAVQEYLGRPSDVVDYRMVQHPIWSTWAQFSRDITETNLIEFAQAIVDNGFNNSQFEIDDEWESCYGSLTVSSKFSNFSETVRQIKSMGFRVSIWVHPFINQDCEPWYTEALTNGYLVLNENGSPDTSWWNNNGSIGSYIDFTNPAAAAWWSGRLRTLIETYDIDSLKFDAGESSFSPQIPVQSGDIDLHPHHIAADYVNTCAQFGDMIEVRTGFRTQNLPIFVRMVDRDSIWGLNNGLSTIITTTIAMNLAGYTLVLPDMIGGNGFNLDHEQSGLPTKELFIRWVQANTFLPAMQYSYVPWNFDNETVEISRRYTELHAAYADEIYAAMQASVNNGTPVNAPIWWVDPTDEEAQVIWDEYLLGENILVAPVLVANATSRDIYLPVGTWYAEGNTEAEYTGPIWIRNYPAPLDTLPYFVKQTEPDAASTSFVSVALVAFGLLLNFL